MNTNEYYYTIEQSVSAEFKDRGSRFIAFAYPIVSAEAAKNHLQQLKKDHIKAVHHCFAYRLGMDGNNFRINDDGEPSGTAGKPILNQIDSKQLTNVLVVVVRYFGGTLLGVPGLIAAYKTATALALQTVPIIQKDITVNYSIQADYTRINELMQIIKQQDCTIMEKQIELFCKINIAIPQKRLEEVLFRLNNLYNIEFKKIG